MDPLSKLPRHSRRLITLRPLVAILDEADQIPVTVADPEVRLFLHLAVVENGLEDVLVAAMAMRVFELGEERTAVVWREGLESPGLLLFDMMAWPSR